jgi:hypothetical protein
MSSPNEREVSSMQAFRFIDTFTSCIYEIESTDPISAFERLFELGVDTECLRYLGDWEDIG